MILAYATQAACGVTFAAFPPAVPPIVPNPQRVIEAAASSKSDILFVVPSFIEVSYRIKF